MLPDTAGPFGPIEQTLTIYQTGVARRDTPVGSECESREKHLPSFSAGPEAVTRPCLSVEAINVVGRRPCMALA